MSFAEKTKTVPSQLNHEHKRSEMFFKGYDHSQLFLQTWLSEKACGTILITHGQSEHSECYSRFIKDFSELSKTQSGKTWNFIAWDMRGHGKSNGLRGYARDIDEYVLDFEIFLKVVSDLNPAKDKPVLLLAHSLGGLVQTCSLLEKKIIPINAQILSSPFFGVGVSVPAWKDLGSEFLNKIFPKVTLGNEIKNEYLTRDPEFIREYELDSYRHNKISSGVYLSAKREFGKVLARAGEVQVPTFLMISDNDPVVSSSAAMSFFDSISATNKGLKIVEGGKHELLNDIGRKETTKTLFEYCSQFI